MRIKEKICMKRMQLEMEGPITIVAFGDSVTQGAVETDQFDYENVYWNLLRKNILNVRNYIPVNVINAGIGGVTAKDSIKRIDAQVLSHRPDLIIICFGLNDVNESLDDYLESLQIIFEKCKASDTEVIFMTPNMLNTYVDKDVPKELLEYAEITAGFQNSGKMDLFIASAIMLAQKMEITVCDCYGVWKWMSKEQDTTKLLANRINHPTKEMHRLFANMLFEILFSDFEFKDIEPDKTMYELKD